MNRDILTKIEILIVEEELKFSKDTMKKTIDDIISTNNIKQVYRWIGLAGGKEKLLRLIKNLSHNFSVEIPKKFYDIVDQASKEWRNVPRTKAFKVYGEETINEEQVEETSIGVLKDRIIKAFDYMKKNMKDEEVKATLIALGCNKCGKKIEDTEFIDILIPTLKFDDGFVIKELYKAVKPFYLKGKFS